MWWLLNALLSNAAFAAQDLIAYDLTGSKTFNSLSIGTMMHLWVAIGGPLIDHCYRFFTKSTAAPLIYGAWGSAISAGVLLPMYALCLYFANGLLYKAYAVGEREGDINPGIAASLSNISLVISSVLPVLFYGSQLALHNVLGIIIYLIGAYFLTKREVKTAKTAKPTDDRDVSGKQWWEWLAFALGSGLLYGIGAFLGYVITKRRRTSVGGTFSQSYALYLSQALIGIMISILVAVKPSIAREGMLQSYNADLYRIMDSPSFAFITMIGGLSGAAGITALFNSYTTAPNPGFSDAVSNLYTATVAIASWLLFGASIGKSQIMGLVLSGLSIVLLST
tara:strand:- start:9879 stop:10889 length:1011 start_codon:yes stop_codon:yes gene_type:complete